VGARAEAHREAEDEEDVVAASRSGRSCWPRSSPGSSRTAYDRPFPNLNDLLDGGFMRKELGYIAARESVGQDRLTLQLGLTPPNSGTRR